MEQSCKANYQLWKGCKLNVPCSSWKDAHIIFGDDFVARHSVGIVKSVRFSKGRPKFDVYFEEIGVTYTDYSVSYCVKYCENYPPGFVMADADLTENQNSKMKGCRTHSIKRKKENVESEDELPKSLTENISRKKTLCTMDRQLVLYFVFLLKSNATRFQNGKVLQFFQEFSKENLRSVVKNDKKWLVPALIAAKVFPLKMAIQYGNSEMIALLLAGGAKADQSTLMMALRFGQKDATNALLKKRLKVNAKLGGTPGQTALIYVCSATTCKQLVTIKPKQPPLSRLSEKENQSVFVANKPAPMWEMAGVLVENGADPNIADKNGRTALMAAISSGCVKTTTLLLKSETHLDNKDSEGQTALMIAAKKGLKSIINLLIKKGASVLAKDKHGLNACMLAMQQHAHVSNVRSSFQAKELEDIVLLLLEEEVRNENKHTNLQEVLRLGFSKDMKNVVCWLIRNGVVDLEAIDSSSDSFLIKAAKEGRSWALKPLLEAGACIDAKNTSGNTALVEAAIRLQADAVQILIEKGADVNVKNISLDSALSAVAKASVALEFWGLQESYLPTSFACPVPRPSSTRSMLFKIVFLLLKKGAVTAVLTNSLCSCLLNLLNNFNAPPHELDEIASFSGLSWNGKGNSDKLKTLVRTLQTLLKFDGNPKQMQGSLNYKGSTKHKRGAYIDKNQTQLKKPRAGRRLL